MTPILYEKDEIDFTSQGLGSLVEIYDADIAEQRNGLLQLTASYPVSGLRYADISVGRIILAKPNQRDDVHAFRIVSTELDVTGYSLMIEADSITYDLNHNIVKHLNVSGADGQTMMSALKNAIVNPSIFNFYSDINHVSSTSLDYVNPMEAIIGVKGSFLQIWGGELKRENRRVAMFNRRGRDNVATFRLGKNIAGLKYSVDISSLVTRIIPTKSVQNDDQTTTTLEGTPVDSQYINNYEQIYTSPLEFTDDAIKTVADLNAAAKGWFTKSANTGRDKPTATIDIDVLSLQDSSDYQDKFKNLESVSLTDTVTVYVPEYGVNVTAIVNELHYDPILDRVTKMTVGTAKQSFADSSRTQLSDLQDKIISVQNQADAVAVSADGKSTNYYGSVEPSHPQEGDTWFWVNGDKSGIKVFVNGDWVEPVDSDTQEKIAAGVTEAVSQAKAHTDEVKQGLSSDISTAKSQATSQASTAEANAKSEATSLFNRAQNALSAAKTDLTNSIASEESARTQAVAAANSQAQTYANQAKADALNTIAKEVTDRQNAVSALDTKATNAVNQAKSDINDTINAISVGGRNYILNSKRTLSSQVDASDTWWVDTSIPISAFSNKVFTISVKVDYDNVTAITGDSNLGFEIVANEVQPDGSIKARYFGVWRSAKVGESFHGRVSATFDMSGITLSSIYSPNRWGQGLYIRRIAATNVSVSNPKMEAGNVATDYSPAPEDVVLDYTTKDEQIKATFSQYQTTNDGKVTKAQTDATTALGQVATKVSQTDYDTKTGDLTTKYTQVKQTADSQATDIVNIKATATSQASKINSISSDVDGTKQSISDIETTQDSQSDKINQITTDVNGTKQSITDIQTKDGKQDTRMGTIETSVSGVKSDFSTYKTDANGRISTAQTTAQTAVDGLKTKVSQTDYNTKTGQLQTDLTTTTQTANQAKTDIVSIKQADTSQDSRMNTIESDASGTKQTVSQLQTVQGQQSGSISTLQQRADGFDATVTKVNNLAVGSRNLYINTTQVQGYVSASNGTIFYQNNPNKEMSSDYIPVLPNTQYTFQAWGSLLSGQQYWACIGQYGSDKSFLNRSAGMYSVPAVTTDTPNDYEKTTITTSTNTYFVRVSSRTFGNYKVKFEKGNMPTDWTPAPEDTVTAISQVSQKADNISNFVRDSSGNISSNFQTALSKTSIITGSTLASSIQKQTSSQISSALTDNNGKIISLINQDSSGVQIAGKNLAITADTTVDGNFWANQVNAVKVNATNITVGTLNGNQVNITNINANNIVSGSISGANLNINLNTGSVVFQKGRINSSDYTTDINIDQGYISTANGNTRALLAQGKLQLIDPTLFSPQTNPYLEISNRSGLFNGMAALVKARDSLTVSINGYDERAYDTPLSTEEFVGLSIGKSSNKLMPTKIGGANQGVIISGGKQYTDGVFGVPHIYVGSDITGAYPNGDRIYLKASYLHSISTYTRTTSSSSNVFVAQDGAFLRSSSSSKYKLDIEYEQQAETANRLLTLDPATWHDKFESKQLDKYHEIGVDPERTIDMSNRRYYGIIAEDLVKAGLEHLVSRNIKTGEVEGVEYSKIGVALIPIIRDLRNRLNDQRVEIERLKEKIK